MLHNQLESCPSENAPFVDFFQLMRSIERETGLRLGSDLREHEEPVKLRASSESQFPSNEVVLWNSAGERPEVTVSFFGLFGASGALPQHYTELIVKRSRIKDFALRDFLDMFNHRLLSFFYRCWEKHQFPVAYETAHAAGRQDAVTGLLKSLTGFRTEGLWDRMSFPSRDTLFFSGHFANRRPTADALCKMIGAAFDIPVEIAQFVGQLMFIEPSQQTRLGNSPLGVSIGNQLGKEAFAGQWVWDFENKFRVCIGPLRLDRFLEFNPATDRFRQVCDFIRVYVGPQFDFEIQVLLSRDDVPMAQLGGAIEARLGWNTWIGQWTAPMDARDAIFQSSL